jgi:GR25 family glycosyltransferase involved in LPS biosynthesis
LNNIFDNIYILNLKRRDDKMTKIADKMSQFNIIFERFDAIDGINIDFKKIKNNWHSSNKEENYKYEIACLLSHKMIIQDAKKNNYKKILILEDDVLLHKNILQKVESIGYLNDWKIVYLGCSQHNWNIVKYDDNFYFSEESLGTFAYALDCSIYDEIIEILENTDTTVDNTLLLIQKKFYKNCYTFLPNLIIADVSDSDIRKPRNQNEHSIKMNWNLQDYV